MVVCPTAYLETSMSEFGSTMYSYGGKAMEIPDRLKCKVAPHRNHRFGFENLHIDTMFPSYDNRDVAAQLGAMIFIAERDGNLPKHRRRFKRHNVPNTRCPIFDMSWSTNEYAYTMLAEVLLDYASGRIKQLDMYKCDYELLHALWVQLSEYSRWDRNSISLLENTLLAIADRFDNQNNKWTNVVREWKDRKLLKALSD